MPKLSVRSKLAKWRGVQRPILILGTLAIIVTFVTFSKVYFLGSLLVADSFCNQEHTNIKSMTRNRKIQTEIDDIRNLQMTSSDSSLKFHSFLADILGLIESIQASLPKIEAISEPKIGINETHHPLLKSNPQSDDPTDFFLIEEIRKYVKMKPNRLGKQNFMGANGTFTSIGHACFAMKKELEEYMDYDIGEICNEDWKLAQKLMVHGYDPLPRRRCFSLALKLYRFFKYADCFNISRHELPRWIQQENLNLNSNLSTDFLAH
ncbi:hypothetical protein UlMin_030440 [Ulmus minor]